MSTLPLIVPAGDEAPLRSGLSRKTLRRLVCQACKRKVRVVGVSGTLTTVGCGKCSRQWLVSSEGRAVKL